MLRLHRTEPYVRVAMGAVVLFTSVLYLTALGEAPVNIGVDEARFAVHAQSIATTGRDISGNRTPLFFHITNPLSPADWSDTWWQPMLFYLLAAVFRVAPFSEWSARLPVACLAILDVWLIYAVARRLFSNGWYAVLAASILALTPAHFMFGRQAMDYFCQLPFALAWLWCLILCVETDTAWLPAATGVLLGVGLYCHISSWVVMPFYFAVTHIVLRLSGRSLRASALLAVGFAVPLLPLIPWFWFHPNMPRDMLTNYKVVSDFRLAERVETYWDYFNPSYLFFSGGSNPMFATRRAGVFLMAAALLLPLGVWNILRRSFSVTHAVLLIGFFFAPVPIIAALPQDPKYYTPRDLLVVPFGALICTAGVEWLVNERGRITRIVAAVLILAVPIQFASFARYYFTDYQRWSAPRFDALNLRGVATYVIASDGSARVPAVYLSEDVGEPQAEQWMFYLLTHQRRDLWERTKHFELALVNPIDIPSGSLLVVDAKNPRLDRWPGTALCPVVQVVHDVEGSPAAAILRRN
jgi:4-amino-4-deoxy-L-arabinose transferase-like glycosyltransferase